MEVGDRLAKTVCIIGAGVGGLTAAAYLAQSGYDVTVLEKATTVGGSAGWYVRQGRMFPTGATIAFGLEEQGIFRSICKELQIEAPATLLTHPMDIVLPDRTVSVYQDAARWEEELSRAFPDQIDAVLRFWRTLSRISDTVFAVTETRAALPLRRAVDWGNLPKYAVRHPFRLLGLARYALSTVEDLMRQFGLADNSCLRQLLNAQLLDAVQTDVSKAALLPSSLALAIYRRGSFSVEGGIGQISKRLAERTVDLGGKVVLASPVRSINYNEQSKEWEVESRRVSASYSIVINNAGVSFGPGTRCEREQEVAWGACRIDAIVHDVVWKETLNGRALPFAYQIVPDPKNAALFGDEYGPVYVTFHRSMDATGQPIAGEMMMTASVHTPPEAWTFASKEAYRAKKEQVAQAMLDEIDNVIPVKQHLLRLDAGTPSTYQTYIGKSEVGGFPLTVANAITKPRGVRGLAPQLYVTGEQVFPGPGTLSAALSGYYAARAIMHEHPHARYNLK